MITISLAHLVIVGLIAAVLLALTMRSVILRDRAMIRRREDARLQLDYEKRWRKPDAAGPA